MIFYSSEYFNKYSTTRVLVNTGSTLIQAVNDEEVGSGLVSPVSYTHLTLPTIYSV